MSAGNIDEDGLGLLSWISPLTMLKGLDMLPGAARVRALAVLANEEQEALSVPDDVSDRFFPAQGVSQK